MADTLRRHIERARTRLKRLLLPIIRAALRAGVDPAIARYHVLLGESIDEYFERAPHRAGESLERVHPERTFINPLPVNVTDRAALSARRGWWGYSFRDVPERTSAATRIVTLQGCTVIPAIDPESREFGVGILNSDGRALDIHEMRVGDVQEDVLRSGAPAAELESATWILERVYHNHSHWLTAHLPKLILLKERGELDDVLMPPAMTDVMRRSLEMAGIDPSAFRTFEPNRPHRIDTLRVVVTDRFRPELLHGVRTAFSRTTGGGSRRIYISRDRASRRRLVNESDILPLLLDHDFERVFLEELPFESQVALMQAADVVVAPHGAGLTNVIFCRPGTDVVEIADPGFPNPNFYALSSAMGHRYWYVPAESIGTSHPLERDLTVSQSAVEGVLGRIGIVPFSARRVE